MSKHRYAKTLAEMSVAKAKKAKRKARRAVHGPYAARGRSSTLQLRRQVEDAIFNADLEDFARHAKNALTAVSTSRESSLRGRKAD